MKTEKLISFWAKALCLAQNSKKEERLAEILKVQKKERLLPEILKKARKISLKKNQALVFLARNYSLDFVEKIKKRFSDIVGKDKKTEIIVDSDIIGGFEIKTEKNLVKASIKDFLKEIGDNYAREN